MRRLEPEEWRQLIVEFEAGELSQKEFVAKHEVSLATFQFHLYKFRRRQRTLNSESPAAFLPVEVVTCPAPKARQPGVVEAALRNGLVVRFAVGTDTRNLAELLAALG